jgi:signal transduction histidine kinase
MNRDERRLLWSVAILLVALLGLAGVLLRGFVARTIAADTKVQTAFLDLSLRDRSRYLGETLRERVSERKWPEDLSDILTRNHADYNRDIFIQVFDVKGALVAQSANTPSGVPLAVFEAGGTFENPSWKTADRVVDGRRLRLVSYPIYTGEPGEWIVFGYTQAGLIFPNTDRALAQFTWVMIASLVGLGALFIIALRAAVLAAASRLKHEQELMQAAQHRFVADAAHELGTPLAVLRGEIDLALRRDRQAEDYRTALASCREEIERLSRLSENLLALATADAGQGLVHRDEADLSAIAHLVQKRFARIAAEKGVALQVEAPASLICEADGMALEQVLGNLVSNALRHTPAGESVSIAIRDFGESCELAVADTGEGIPPSHLPRLFDRFHRVDKARSRAAGGAGLGLAIVKTLIEAHGGSISIQSELGKGSTFTCRFPKSVAPAKSAS